MSILISVVGMFVLIGIAVLASNQRGAIRLRTVSGAFAIQLFFGAFVLYFPAGKSALLGISSGVQKVIDYGNDGITFIFGGLNSDRMFELFEGSGFVFKPFNILLVFCLYIIFTILFISLLILFNPRS